MFVGTTTKSEIYEISEIEWISSMGHNAEAFVSPALWHEPVLRGEVPRAAVRHRNGPAAPGAVFARGDRNDETEGLICVILTCR